MNQNELTQSLMNELFTLPEEKIREVKDFILFLKYRSNPDFHSKMDKGSFLKNPRQGWNESFALMAKEGDDLLIDEDLTGQSKWDNEEWEWK